MIEAAIDPSPLFYAAEPGVLMTQLPPSSTQALSLNPPSWIGIVGPRSERHVSLKRTRRRLAVTLFMVSSN